ncbi:hypothetical protein [Roseateles terrae]|uniref:PIN domain-containing protein n=1 Tax=Roseateles terrae TaxID=431060 RepID=A0ABR6GRC1_9BURK|nr:hypothetical protein [Roseateles terrae]MBB3193708.1 hypothetical protein [Roseateles terrae]OWQ89133.1 hypothetical protein CDN98_00855 [Roseateles terrae]
MTLHDTLVVLDTCVLLRLRLADVLMDLRAEKVFAAHWTPEIDQEFLRTWHRGTGSYSQGLAAHRGGVETSSILTD